jgi:hypothetical protein
MSRPGLDGGQVARADDITGFQTDEHRNRMAIFGGSAPPSGTLNVSTMRMADGTPSRSINTFSQHVATLTNGFGRFIKAV